MRGETIFQIVGATERKPRAPNEMLQLVTDRRLAEADRRVLHGACTHTDAAKRFTPTTVVGKSKDYGETEICFQCAVKDSKCDGRRATIAIITFTVYITQRL